MKLFYTCLTIKLRKRDDYIFIFQLLKKIHLYRNKRKNKINNKNHNVDRQPILIFAYVFSTEHQLFA